MVGSASYLKLGACSRVPAIGVLSLERDPSGLIEFRFFLADPDPMRQVMRPYPQERYALENGRYVLYLGKVRLLTARALALLLDMKLGVLITHGDPVSVLNELDEMRDIALSTGMTHYERDWLLLEGRPQLDALNAALAGRVDLAALKAAFSREQEQEADRITQELFDRLRCRR